MGPRPLRQGAMAAPRPPLLPSPSTSVPSSPAHRETDSLSLTGSRTEQIGGTYAISCRRAQGADALSPNRFSCYQLGGGSELVGGGGGGGRSAGAPRDAGRELTFHGCFRLIETQGKLTARAWCVFS